MWAENHLALVWSSKFTCFSWVVEVDLIPKSKEFYFISVRDYEVDLVVLLVVERDLVFVSIRK